MNGPTSSFLLASSLKQPSLFGYKIHKKKSLFGYKQVSSKHKLYWNQIPTIQIQSHKQHLHADGAPLLRAQQLLYRSVSHNPWNTSRAASACTIAKSTAVNRVEIQIITHTHARARTHMFIQQKATAWQIQHSRSPPFLLARHASTASLTVRKIQASPLLSTSRASFILWITCHPGLARAIYTLLFSARLGGYFT